MLRDKKMLQALAGLFALSLAAWGLGSGGTASNGESETLYRLSASYPYTETFDMDYYLETHIPLVEELWADNGLLEVRIDRGVAVPGSEDNAPLVVMTLLTFGSLEDLEAALAEDGDAIVGDIPNFTDAGVELQINESIR